MKLAVLPFNAAEGASPGLGRQFSNFASDAVRAGTDAEINTVSLLTQVDQDGIQRTALVNISEGLLEEQWITDLFKQSQCDVVMDGMLQQPDGKYSLTVRFHKNGEATPIFDHTYDFEPAGVFDTVRSLIGEIAKQTEAKPNEGIDFAAMDFGTDDPSVFLKFLEGYDALMYLQQAQGAVVKEFTPVPALDMLREAAEADVDFDGPYHALIALCRACAARRIGTFEALEACLKKLQELRPEEFAAYFALGEVYQTINDAARACDQYEKAVQKAPNDPALYVRLGMAQMASGMPVNAERNFRKAMELEGDEKPSADFLANVLVQTNREHEVPPIWKALIDENPQNSQAQAKYALSLVQAGREADGQAAFEKALEVLEDSTIVKRFYAPMLATKGELDRAMDFYEDVLDTEPNDVPTMLEYARVLQQADREFEIPNVLKNVLSSNPDPNTRATTLAWLIELEQPKRVENVESAQKKMEDGEFETAIKELKPLRNWLADYWKLWALLSAAYNRVGDGVEAEAAARRLLELFPGCEPAYGELCSALNGQGKNDEAYNLMRFAAANMPGSLPIHLNLALAAKRAGHADEAKAIARQIREATGSNADLSKELTPMLDEIEGP
jgi:Flp pilus assembly protein TadD